MIRDQFTHDELEFIKSKYCKSAQAIRQVKSENYGHVYQKVMSATSFLPARIKFKIRLWHVLCDVDELPVCSICGSTYHTPNENLRIDSPLDVFPYSNHCSEKKKRRTTKSFIDESKKIHGDILDYHMTEYVDMMTPVRFRCKRHDITFTQRPQNHLGSTYPCPECKKEALSAQHRITRDEWLERFRSVWGDLYDYSLVDGHENATSRIVVICRKHGPWETNFFNHFNEKLGCPQCSYDRYENSDTIRSKPEIELYDFVRSILPPDIEVNHSNRSVLDGKEMDIWIPSLNFGIEYNGIFHHSSYNTHKNYHLNKTKRADKRGIRLIHVFSDEWEHKRDIVETKLRCILGVSERKRIYARNTTCHQVSNSGIKEFYDKHHIQGHMPTASVVYVLKHQEEVVAAISFKRMGDGEWDLARYATSQDVVGGFSKLLAHFKRRNRWTSIITFADRRWSNGDLYHATGFTEVSRSAPMYSYVVGTRRQHRQSFTHDKMKQKLERYDPAKSEFENMDEHKIYRIYDCGLIKFVMYNKEIDQE